MPYLTTEFIEWLKQNVSELDQSNQYADQLFEKLSREDGFKYGIPIELGGKGGTIQQAVEFIQEIANYSLTAAFIAWGHRTLIQNLIETDNPIPREKWLAKLLDGKLAGGTGLSNAVKFLSGIEELQVKITEKQGKFYLNGRLPWVTNLSKKGFITIFVAEYETKQKPPIIIAIPSGIDGLIRNEELSLVALQGSNTVSVSFDNVELNSDWIIAENAASYLSKIRPAFLGLQCGMAFGVAERALKEVEHSLSGNRMILQSEWQNQIDKLQQLRQQLFQGLSQLEYFIQYPKLLFQIRIDVVDIVSQSLLLELQASGGRAYLSNSGSSFIRRWREGAFLPVVTPSVLQLKTILQTTN